MLPLLLVCTAVSLHEYGPWGVITVTSALAFIVTEATVSAAQMTVHD